MLLNPPPTQQQQQRSLSATSSKASLRLPLESVDSFTTCTNLTPANTLNVFQPKLPSPSSAAAAVRLDSTSLAGHHHQQHHHNYQLYQQQQAPSYYHDASAASAATQNADSPLLAKHHQPSAMDSAAKPIKRSSSSLISFKSLDFNLKNIYTNMKHKGRDATATTAAATQQQACGSGSGGSSKNDTTSSSKTSISRTPYVRVETVDYDESHDNMLLLHYQQRSAYGGQRPRGSLDNKSPGGSQYLTASSTVTDYASSRSQATSPSAFLTITQPPNVRRSSTSDICDSRNKLTVAVAAGGGGATALLPPGDGAAAARRPSTSDLLRRARERKAGPDAVGTKMGRSISQGGLPRGGGRGGRRTSIAF